ncbi:MAG: TolC family protein [Gemmataceae bacterium]|nr:TolC family protein [Gemmataceae bacterium]
MLALSCVAAKGDTPAELPAVRPTLGFVEVPDLPATLPPPRSIGEPPGVGQVITLEESLRRAGFANPTIALAQEGVFAGEALRLQARALLLPSFTAGVNVRLHQGNLQTARGIITRNSIESLYAGAGAQATGGGTTGVPGIRILSHLGDALLEPRLAELRLTALQSDARAISRSVLADVMTRYLVLTAIQARLAALDQTLEEMNEVARITGNFAAAGQGRAGDAERARSEYHLAQAEKDRLQGDLLAAAADLARLLDLDPSSPLRPADFDPPLLEWYDPSAPLEALIPVAVQQRPELSARGAEIAFGQTRVRQERLRPWLPTLSIGYSAGAFGGGSSSRDVSFSALSGREDFDAYAVWTLRNLGLGNRAEVNRARAQTRIAEAEYARTLQIVRRETAEAHSLVRLRKVEMTNARLRVEHASQAFEQDLQRTRNLQGRPIETLNSINLLRAARQDLVAAMAGYSEAQVQLLFAVGRDMDGMHHRGQAAHCESQTRPE